MKKIYSLNLVSYLHTMGLKEVKMDKDTKSKSTFFVFEESDDVKNAIESYKKSDVTVNLHEFTTKFKEIKKQIAEFNA